MVSFKNGRRYLRLFRLLRARWKRAANEVRKSRGSDRSLVK
jgi:hypothetical protein